MDLKPIETQYNGYRFRSRLEARWAVFFDETGIQYEYEPEGFDLDGVWYLPDFRIQVPFYVVPLTPPHEPIQALSAPMWIEVKPPTDSLGDDTATKLACFSYANPQGIILAQGDPYTFALRYFVCRPGVGGAIFYVIFAENEFGMGIFGVQFDALTTRAGDEALTTALKSGYIASGKPVAAMRAARKARF